MWSRIQSILAVSLLLVSISITTVIADEASNNEIPTDHQQPTTDQPEGIPVEKSGKNYRLADYHYFVNTSDHMITLYVGDFFPEVVTLFPGQGRYIYMSTRHQMIEIGNAW